MTQVEIRDAARGRDVGYKVDASRGERVSRVSSEWFSRPSDERYLSLSGLFAAVRGRTERSRTRTVDSAAIRVEASRDDAERLSLAMPGFNSPVAMTHWSFGQLASLVGAPAAYLRQLPAPLAGINLQFGLTSHRAEQVKTLDVTLQQIVRMRRFTHSAAAYLRITLGNIIEYAAITITPPTAGAPSMADANSLKRLEPVRQHVDSIESVVIQSRGLIRSGLRRCGPTRTAVATTAAIYGIPAI